MTNDYLEGSDLYRVIADAKDAGEGPEVFEALCPNSFVLTTVSWERLVEYSEKFGYKIRRKPQIKSLKDSRNYRWTWPEPVKTPLEINESYFFIDLANHLSGIGNSIWLNTVSDMDRLKNMIIHKDRKAIEQHRDALMAVNKG